MSSRSEEDKWLLWTEFLFKENYLSGKKYGDELSERSLGFTTFSRLERIRRIIVNDLGPFIELRNRLVHGQWHVLFNKDPYKIHTGKNIDLTTKAWKMTKKEIILMKALVKRLPKVVNAFLISKENFEVSYDRQILYITEAVEDADLRYQNLLSVKKRTKYSNWGN